MPPTTTAAAASQLGFSQLGSPAYGSTPRESSQEFPRNYTLSPALSAVNPARSPSLTGSYQNYLADYQPRTGQPIYVVTQDLQLPSAQQAEVPELNDASNWPSSATDSTYSTPTSDVSRNPRPWARGGRSPTADWTAQQQQQRLASYSGTAPRGLRSPGPPSAEGTQVLHPPLFINSYPTSQPQEQPFGGAMLGVQPTGFAPPDAAGHHHHHHAPLSGSSDRTLRQHPHHHHPHGDPISSVRGRTPPMDMSTQPTETLLAPAPVIPNRLDTMMDLDRRKGMMMDTHQDLVGTQAGIGAADALNGLAIAYDSGGGNSSCSVSPGRDDAVTGLGLATMAIPPTAVSLPGPVCDAIPRYLEVYWAQVDPVLPIIHRPSFEASAAEDVLKCAMAAVATQHLDNREDRNRGNQLHEFAWQEVKRVSSDFFFPLFAP